MTFGKLQVKLSTAMTPAEVELKDGWAIGLKPEEKKKVVQPGEILVFLPVHDVSVNIICSETDLQSVVTISDQSIQIQGSKIEYPERKTIVFRDTPVVVKTSSGQEVAVIKHIPDKTST